MLTITPNCKCSSHFCSIAQVLTSAVMSFFPCSLLCQRLRILGFGSLRVEALGSECWLQSFKACLWAVLEPHTLHQAPAPMSARHPICCFIQFLINVRGEIPPLHNLRPFFPFPSQPGSTRSKVQIMMRQPEIFLNFTRQLSCKEPFTFTINFCAAHLLL